LAHTSNYALPRAAMLFMATVDEARKTNEGPFRAIAPLFRVALEPQQGQVLNFEAAARTLQDVLGSSFNVYAVEAFAPQLVELGWLVPEKVDSGVIYRVSTGIFNSEDGVAVEASSKKLDRLYDAFLSFLASSAPLFAFELAKDEFKWQLFRWATSLDGSDKAHIIEHAKALEEGRAPSIKDAYLDETQRFSKIDRTTSVEFAGFVKWLESNGREEIKDIASLTELGLALEFIEELQSPSSRSSSDLETTFVLDAPVILDLMGLSGAARKRSLLTYLSTIKKRGGKIVVLSHNLEEMTDIINSVLARPSSRRFGLTGDALRENPELERLARGIAQSPDVAAKAMDVEIITFDPASPLYEAHFSDAAIDDFRASATWHTDQSKSEQRYRDALSIAFVMRRRQGAHYSDVLETRYVLITRNSTFTRFSELFCRRKLSSPTWAFGPAIEIKTLAAFLWMRFGSEVDRDLPQMQLVAACDRILASNGEILRKAERKLKTLEGSDGALALLNSHQAVLDLVIATGGSADVIDGADGEQLIRALTASAEARGREAERQRANEEQAKLFRALDAANQLSEHRAAEKTELARESVRQEAILRDREAELARRDQSDLARARVAAETIWQASNTLARAVVTSVVLGCAGVTIFGQFFIWRGWDWWVAQPQNFLVGVAVVAASAVLALAGIEMIGKHSVNPQAWARKAIVAARIRAMLLNIPDKQERDRVSAALSGMRT
jgi:hypothetical protein